MTPSQWMSVMVLQQWRTCAFLWTSCQGSSPSRPSTLQWRKASAGQLMHRLLTSHIPSTAQQTLTSLWKSHHSTETSATWMETNLRTLHGMRYVVIWWNKNIELKVSPKISEQSHPLSSSFNNAAFFLIRHYCLIHPLACLNEFLINNHIKSHSSPPCYPMLCYTVIGLISHRVMIEGTDCLPLPNDPALLLYMQLK